MIPGIVLAAGNSSRMGRPKALLPTGPEGELFLERMIRILLDGGVEEVVVVLGRDADLIRAAVPVAARPVRYVDNPAYEDGQLSSLLAGLAAVDRPDVRAVMVTPVDLPLLDRARIGGGRHHRHLGKGRHRSQPEHRAGQAPASFGHCGQSISSLHSVATGVSV